MGIPLFSPTGPYPGVGINPVAVNTPDAPHYGVDSAAREAFDEEAKRKAIPPSPTELVNLEGTPGSSSGNNDMTEGMNAASRVMNLAAPFLNTGPRMGGSPIEPAYSDYSGLDPSPGHALYDDTFITKQAEIEKAINEGAKAEGDYGAAKSDFYKRQQTSQMEEMAVIQQHREERKAELIQRQKSLEEATQRYSNDLADKGQFWKNPGNIISSFASALLNLGSSDVTLGTRLITQAVQQDYAQRKGQADMHLGELRSNLSAYRQLAGDAELGDRLGYAESQRIAAMELERIAGQFQGPLAKAKAAAISKELMRNYQIQTMEIRNRFVHHPAQRQDPGVMAAHQAQGATMPGVGPTPYVKGKPGSFGPNGSGVAGVPGKGASVGAAVGPSSSSYSSFQGSSGGKNPLSDGYMSNADREFLNKRSPGAADQIDTERQDAVQQMLAESGANPGIYRGNMSDAQIQAQLTPQQLVKYNEKNAAYRKWLSEDNKEISTAVQPIASRIAAYRQFGKDIQVMELVAKSMKTTPDELLGQRYKQLFGASNVHTVAEWLAAGEPPTEAHEKQARELMEAKMRFEQSYTKGISAWVKEMSGGTVSAGEDARNAQFIRQDHSWNSIKGFHKGVSQDAHADAKTAIGRAKSGITKTAWLVSIGQEDPGLGYSGIDGYNSFENAQGGNTGRKENSKDPHKGTARDPEVQRLAASKLLSPAQQKAAMGAK